MTTLILDNWDTPSARIAKWIDEGTNVVTIANRETSGTTVNSLWHDKNESTGRTESINHIRSIEVDGYVRSGHVEATALRVAKRNSVDRIIAMSELDIMRAARLRRKLGIDGQSIESGTNFRDKLRMKQVLAQHDIGVTPFGQAQSIIDVMEFVDRHDFPVVIKPRFGAGSAGVVILRSRDDLRQLLVHDGFQTARDTNDLIIEKYVEGKQYHVDGFCVDGKVELVWPSRCVTSGVSFRDNIPYMSHMLEANNPLRRDLSEFVSTAVRALAPPAFTPFHAELFVSVSGDLLINEIGSRLGGNRISDALGLAFNIDPVRLWVQGQCGSIDYSSFSWPSEPVMLTGCAVVPPVKGIVRAVPDRVGVGGVQYSRHASIGDHLDAPQLVSDCVASFVAVGGSEEEVLGNLRNAVTWFSENFQVVDDTSENHSHGNNMAQCCVVSAKTN